jgi:hypothetical protein
MLRVFGALVAANVKTIPEATAGAFNVVAALAI